MSESKYSVPNLERAFDIIELLSNRNDGMTRSEITTTLSIPANSVYRITTTLINRGYMKDNNDNNLKLTDKFLNLICKTSGSQSLTAEAYPVMKELEQQTKETIHLSIRNDFKGIVLEKITGSNDVTVLVKKGHIFDLHSTAPGKIFCSFEEESKILNILDNLNFKQYTKSTITNRENFKQEINKIKKDGYAVDMGETISAINCIAAPVFDNSNNLAGSICLTAPADRLTTSEIPEKAAIVLKCATAISAKIGESVDE